MSSLLVFKPIPTLILGDNSRLVVDAVLKLLESTYTVVQVAADGVDALDLIRRLRPDIAILDVCLPRLDGIAVACRLKDAGSLTRIVLISSIEEEDHIRKAREVAHGFVFKRRILQDLPLALAAAAGGSFYVSGYT